MKEVSKLMDYRADIKVLDATLRDGGLVNEFRFTDDFVKALYLANIRAGVDYMVVGRPITAADDPITAVNLIIDEIEEASKVIL